MYEAATLKFTKISMTVLGANLGQIQVKPPQAA
jgi:hypothetical protein